MSLHFCNSHGNRKPETLSQYATWLFAGFPWFNSWQEQALFCSPQRSDVFYDTSILLWKWCWGIHSWRLSSRSIQLTIYRLWCRVKKPLFPLHASMTRGLITNRTAFLSFITRQNIVCSLQLRRDIFKTMVTKPITNFRVEFTDTHVTFYSRIRY